MDFNIVKDSISLCEAPLKINGEYAVDCDVTLPEYLPDIVRILRCTIIPGVSSHRRDGERITVEGKYIVRVLYICEKGEIHCCEQKSNFVKQLELKDADEHSDFFVSAITDYANYRVSGQRRFEVHGSVTISALCVGKACCEFISDAHGDGITVKSAETELCDLTGIVENAFTITQTCDAGELSEPMGAVIDCHSFAVIEELKVVSEKLFLKGELRIIISFAGSESNEVQTLERSIALSRIAEAAHFTEDCRICSRLAVTDIDIQTRYDSSGEKNLFEVSAALNLSVQGYTKRKTRLISDAYSVAYETDVQKTMLQIPLIEAETDDNFLCRGVADLSPTGVREVLSFVCKSTGCTFSVDGGSALFAGNIAVDIILRDNSGEICFVQRQIPYEYRKNIDNPQLNLSCNPHCTVTASSFVITEGSRLDIRAELNIRGFIFAKSSLMAVSRLTVDKEKPKVRRGSSLTIYFAEEGERLWDIAEKYNTTVQAITGENHISEGCVERKCRLLIPAIREEDIQ